MDHGKILYQAVPAASDTLIYTVPERTATSYTVDASSVEVEPSAVVQHVQTMITQIILCDAVGGGDTIDVHLVSDSSTAAAPGNMVFNAVTVAGGTTERIKLNWLLDGGSTIRVVPTTGARVTVTLLGIEVK